MGCVAPRNRSGNRLKTIIADHIVAKCFWCGRDYGSGKIMTRIRAETKSPSRFKR